MPLTALRLLALGTASAAAYAAYEVRRLHTQYRYEDVIYPPEITALFRPGMFSPGRVRTTIPLSHVPRSAVQHPLDTFLAAFYDTWTLRLEGLAHRQSVKSGADPLPFDAALPRTGEDFAEGLFKGIYRDDSKVAVFWAFPEPSPARGIQVLEARIMDGGMEIAFGGTEFAGPYRPWVNDLLFKFHYLYTRFLVDHAKSKLEKWAREGR